jgi:hypothetical protein
MSPEAVINVTNLSDLETTELRSGASDEVAWVGGFFAYGGKDTWPPDDSKVTGSPNRG